MLVFLLLAIAVALLTDTVPSSRYCNSYLLRFWLVLILLLPLLVLFKVTIALLVPASPWFYHRDREIEKELQDSPVTG